MKTMKPLGFWGTHLWAFIHTVCIIDYELLEAVKHHVDKTILNLEALVMAIPCHKCATEFNHWLHVLKTRDIYAKLELFRWSVDLHNSVNEKLNRRHWTYEEALTKWATQ